MTEAEWDACADPTPMLESLRGKASDRKLRLFAVACCRQVWAWMTDERSRRGVETAERYAEGLVSEDELQDARRGTGGAWTTVWGDGWHIYQAARAAHFACEASADKLLLVPNETKTAARNSIDFGVSPDEAEKIASETARQPNLLRDLFGNPIRPAALDPAWLAWNDGAVRKMAQAIYQERRFADLALLADALEDAGCADAVILAHCRGGGEHVRGCWVVDLLLGKA
jgi:hypothetical protein